MRKIYTATILAVLLVGATSCKKFVEEELVSSLTFDYYKTDKGLEDLVETAYIPLRWKFNGEQSYTMHNFGDDEFIVGDQFNNVHYNDYSSLLNSNETFLNEFWKNNYDGINRCNIGIELLGSFNDGSSTLLGTAAKRAVRTAELRFLRGLYYFQLVQQFGGVPLVLSASREVRTDFSRATTADVYKAIIADFIYAKDNLPVYTTSSLAGRAYKGAAQHFLAKAYLTRASATSSEAKTERGTLAGDLDSTITHATAVINGPYVLESDYMNLWGGVYPNGYPNVTTPDIGKNGTAPVGDYNKIKAANASREIIFAAQFINDQVYNGQTINPTTGAATNVGNKVHLYFGMQYDSGIPGMARDQFNDRPFRRLGPSDYTIDLYDRKNDSRFYKSFRTAYYANSGNNLPKFGLGDTAALFIVNDRTNPILESDLTKYRYRVYARWIKNASGDILRGYTESKYLTLVKHLDPVRVTTIVNEESGVRNGILARLAETHLILAEAYGRKGLYNEALVQVNKVRQRAAYKAGEFKNPQTWKFDGLQKGDVSDTYANLEAKATLFTTNAATELYPVGVNSTEDRFIHFMLNERTRELCGELYRWEDLVRTETLYQRVNVATGKYQKDNVTFFNNARAGAGIQPYHKLRPIPNQQIELTTIDGKPMTTDQKTRYQNPGY